jgi:hypothetical protein
LTPDKSQVLDDLCDIFDLINIAKNPTCFMKGCEPSLVDVILNQVPAIYQESKYHS